MGRKKSKDVEVITKPEVVSRLINEATDKKGNVGKIRNFAKGSRKSKDVTAKKLLKKMNIEDDEDDEDGEEDESG